MATTLQFAKLDVSCKTRFDNVLDQDNARLERNHSFTDSMTDGNAIDLAQVMFYDERSVAASGTDSINLESTLTDAFGNTLDFTKIKGVIIENRSVTVGDILEVTSPAVNGFVGMLKTAGDAIEVHPGGLFLWWDPSAAGAAVGTGADNLLNIVEAGGANTVTYRITLLGTDS